MNQVIHGTMRLDSAIRTAIPHHIRRVLRGWASTNHHDNISLNRLFLKVADGLVQDDLLDMPGSLGASSFEGLADKPCPAHPDYKLDHDVATLVRQTIWEQFIQGILAPDPRRIVAYLPQGVLDLRYASLTPYGVEVLSLADDHILVHDPEGYLVSLQEAEPPPDNEMTAYLEESLAVFRGGHLRATVLLLHMASERLLDCLATALGHALARDGHENAFHGDYRKTPSVSARFDCLQTMLMGTYDHQLRQNKLKHGFECVFKPTFHSIRLARNEIAHRGRRDFTWNDVSQLLSLFAQSFHHANPIIAFLRAQS